MSSPSHASPAAPSSYLPEVDGIRGIALVLVVAFHLFGAGRVSGGVDVFLVVTGFFVTRSVYERASRGDRDVLARHYGRSLHRLVPSSLVVLAAVTVAMAVLVPMTARAQTAREIVASLLYVENWSLIAAAQSYDAAGDGASALQHYWSLAVQAQFLLVWPVAILLVVRLARATGRDSYRPALALAGLATAASFGYALVLVARDQPVAYLHTGARWWQLALGGLVALALARSSVPPRVRGPLAATGIVLVVSCGFVMDGSGTFPGAAALWPVLGALAVIAGSGGDPAGPVRRSLDLPPVRWLTRHAYQLYLWHWPLLVYWLVWQDRSRLGWRSAVAILLVSCVAAALTRRLVAEPVLVWHGLRSPRAAALGAVGVLAVVGAVAVLGTSYLATPRPLTAAGDAAFVPSIYEADQDRPAIYSTPRCVQQSGDGARKGEVLVCHRGPGGVSAPATRTVVLSGGSHAGHWYPALAGIAEQHGWDVVVVDKTGCRLAAPDSDLALRESCAQWNYDVVDVIADLAPDAVLTVGTRTVGSRGDEWLPGAQVERWRELDARGVPVLALRDTPRFSFRVPECIEREDGDHTSCSRPRKTALADVSPLLTATELPATLVPLDLSDEFCTATTCPTVIDGILVYRDRDHITATFAATLAGPLEAALRAGAPWLFDEEPFALVTSE